MVIKSNDHVQRAKKKDNDGCSKKTEEITTEQKCG